MSVPCKEASLYIHIPFCSVLCPFCDFYKVGVDSELEQHFIDACCKEIRLYKKNPPIKIPTIFLGGGTPSILKKKHLQLLFETIHDTFDTSALKECSIEANPEDISEDYLKTLQELGFTRLSLGVQSFNEKECHFLGRGHDVNTSIHALNLIKTFPFTLSIDLMYGLPNSNWTSIEHSLKQALEFSPQHLSTYCLSIEPNTVFFKKKIKSAGQEKEYHFYNKCMTFLKKQGFTHYEVCSFAKKNHECIHNKRYWTFKDFIGIGPSAHSLIFPYKYSNTPSLKQYIKNPTPSLFQKEKPLLTQKDLIIENIIANLRMPKGINIHKFNTRYSISIKDTFKHALEVAEKQKWLHINEKSISTTEKGLYLLDEVCLLFV
ncbi:hypothetical protein DID78_01490 [Candidatus Marinamargulisbacteria bacterium SCGC AG-343-D04]|nr:hypothetical protein DID78_01490 [Candidatus Marinamargulisbacteria bacterium SCGC AG-343-D04]